jgi:hypothetical protein
MMTGLQRDPRFELVEQRREGPDVWQAFLDQTTAQTKDQVDRLRQKLDALRKTATEDPPKAEWTVLVYMAAFDSADEQATGALAEILDGGSTPQVNVLVHCDRQDGATRYIVGKPGEEAIEESLNDSRSGDPLAVIDAMRWAVDQRPADRYGLVIRSHGSTWTSEELRDLR